MRSRPAVLAACALVAIVLYLPTLRYDFVFDDAAVIGLNPVLTDVRDLPRAATAPYWNIPSHARSLYRPLTSLSFAVNRWVAGGLRPMSFHLFNVFCHALATVLVTLLAFEVLPGLVAPFLAGVLFAVHPVHVEAVAGIVGRSEILAAGGVLGAVLAHRRALTARAGRPAVAWGGIAAAATLCGVLAKESAAVAPLLCLLGEALPAGASVAPPAPSRRRRVVLYAAEGGAVALYLLARWRVLGSLGVGAPIPFVDNPAVAAGPWLGRLTGVACLLRYAVLLIWPRLLAADYSYNQIAVVESPFEPAVLGGALLLLAVVGGGLGALRRVPALGFALLWMAIAASLTTNLLVFIGTILAERLMYLPSAGLCLLAGAAVASARRPGTRAAVAVAVGAACLLGTARAAIRLPEWKDDFSLYRSAALVSPRSARIRYNLGNAWLRRGDFRAAEENYLQALRIYPDFDDARVNAGMAILQQGRAREALDLLGEASRREPGSADLAVNLGAAWRAAGEPSRAEAEFRRALSLDPGSARAWNNLGSVALARGDLPAALEALRRAVAIEPGFATFRVNLADALAAAGRFAEADAEFEAAARVDPDLPEARRGLGERALRRGDEAEAEREFRRAAAGRPPSARAENFLGYLLARRGDARGAAARYEQALRIDPDLADAHRSLGLLYAGHLGDRARAALHLQRSLDLDPGQAGAADMTRLLLDLYGGRGGRGPAVPSSPPSSPERARP